MKVQVCCARWFVEPWIISQASILSFVMIIIMIIIIIIWWILNKSAYWRWVKVIQKLANQACWQTGWLAAV